MQALHPIAHSFAILCIGAAIAVGWLEWRDPYDLKAGMATGPVKTASNLPKRMSVTNGRRPARPPRSTPTELVVQLDRRHVQVFRNSEAVKQYPVAIGQAEWETPVGEFTVTGKQKSPAWEHPITGEVIPAGSDNPLGSRWIGFWSGDDNTQIGFHGTNQESLIGEAVSHGCIRMLNQHIEDLYDYVDVGTRVIVQR